MGNAVVATITPRQRGVRHWFYIDIVQALTPGADREEAIFSVPEDRKVKANFDRDILLDLSTREAEYENLRFPLNRAFDLDDWHEGFWFYWLRKDGMTKAAIDAKVAMFTRFKNEVLHNFTGYLVQVIALAHDTSHEAVCLVFEKVNTGGKGLDAFELVTAMYAAQNYRLRDDWYGAPGRPSEDGHPASRRLSVSTVVFRSMDVTE